LLITLLISFGKDSLIESLVMKARVVSVWSEPSNPGSRIYMRIVFLFFWKWLLSSRLFSVPLISCQALVSKKAYRLTTHFATGGW